MSTALAQIERPNIPAVSEFGVIKETASMLVKTGFLPQAIKTPEQALAIILTGRELGIGTMAALNTINVIQGKPTVSPQLMLALIERSGQLENIEYKTDATSVTCTMKRKGRSAHAETFGTKEATAMGLNGKDNYKKQATVMYKWRATAACARTIFPDVILGLYTPDELGANTNEDGEAIASAPLTVVSSAPAPVDYIDAEPTVETNPAMSAKQFDDQRLANIQAEIQETCKALNASKLDSKKWSKLTLDAHALELLGAEYGELTYEQLTFLAEDQQERFEMLTKSEDK